MRLATLLVIGTLLPIPVSAQRIARKVANIDVSGERSATPRYDAKRRLWLHYGGD